MRYPSGEIQQTGSEIPTYISLLLDYSLLGYLLPTTKKRVHDELYYADWDRQSRRDVKVIPGSCTLMRKHDLRLDDDLLLYFPEDSLAREHQGNACLLPDARILHHEKSSTQSWFATSIFFRDLLVYCHKRHGTLRMLLLWLLSRPVYWTMRWKNR